VKKSESAKARRLMKVMNLSTYCCVTGERQPDVKSATNS
jgi:hypothetical protein